MDFYIAFKLIVPMCYLKEIYMKIEFELTEQDFVDFNIFHFENSKSVRSAHRKARFLAPVLFMAIPFVMKNVSEIPFLYWFVIFLILSILWVTLYPARMKKSIEKSVRKVLLERPNSIFGKKTVTLTDKGILTSGEDNNSEISYSAISEISESKKGTLYLYNSSLSAIIIPQSAFKYDTHKKEFLDELNKKRGSSSVQPELKKEPEQPKRKSIYDIMDDI